MNNRYDSMAVLLALAALVALGLGVFLFFQDVYQFLKALDQEVTAILMVILISALFIGFSIRRAGRVYGIQRLRLEKKAQCYERFVRAWSNVLARNSEDSASIKTATDELEAAAEQLKLWASVEVIRQLATIRNRGAWSKDEANVRSAMEFIVRAMRVDLGQNNLRLSPGDLGS